MKLGWNKRKEICAIIFSHLISNTFFLVLLCVESTKGRARKEKKILSFEILTSVWRAESSTHGKEISNEQYKTVFNRVPKVIKSS